MCWKFLVNRKTLQKPFIFPIYRFDDMLNRCSKSFIFLISNNTIDFYYQGNHLPYRMRYQFYCPINVWFYLIKPNNSSQPNTTLFTWFGSSWSASQQSIELLGNHNSYEIINRFLQYYHRLNLTRDNKTNRQTIVKSTLWIFFISKSVTVLVTSKIFFYFRSDIVKIVKIFINWSLEITFISCPPWINVLINA